MKQYEYIIEFTNGNYKKETVRLWAGNLDNAIILAKAERIKEGLDHTIVNCEKVV